MEETITLKEGTEENPVLIVTTPVVKEVSLESLKARRASELNQISQLENQILVKKENVKDLDTTIAKAEEVIDGQA